MADPIDQTLDDFFDLGAELHRLDRFHRAPACAPDRPVRVVRDIAAAARASDLGRRRSRTARTAGIYVVVEEHPSASRTDTLPTRASPGLSTVPGVAGAWTFATLADLTSRRWTGGRSPHHRVLARRPLHVEVAAGSAARRAA